jgi:lycopene cyclase domain-containing protein
MSNSTTITANMPPRAARRVWVALLLGLFVPALAMVFIISIAPEIVFDTDAAKIVAKTSLQLAWSEHKNWYLWIMGGVIVFPFLLSFDKRVHFYRKWQFVLPAVLANAAFFIPWDVYYTHINVWGFNDRYFDGTLLGLPYGEWLFFIVVPYACVFVHECLTVYIRPDLLQTLDKVLSYALIAIFFAVGIIFYQKIYTAWAFLLSGGLLLAHYIAVPNTYRTRFYLSFVVCLLPFLITNGILTGAVNQEPIVIYNDAHNLSSVLGFRMITIPVDDLAYGFLLLFVPIVIFEELRQAANRNTNIETL